MNDILLKVKDLSKSFGSNVVLNKVNLSLKRGDNIVILGKSGSGKSVLTKCIVGLIMYDSGIIEVFNKDISDMNIDEEYNIRDKIGYLFQGGALYDSMTVRENLEFPIRRSRFEKDAQKDIDIRVEEALENVGLLHAIEKMPSELSGGMKKRIGLARTLILNPEIIIYDEPTTGLDPVTAGEISELIIEIQEKYNTSSIIITHDIKCAELTANEIKILKDGHFYAEGNLQELKNSADKEVNAYFK